MLLSLNFMHSAVFIVSINPIHVVALYNILSTSFGYLNSLGILTISQPKSFLISLTASKMSTIILSDPKANQV